MTHFYVPWLISMCHDSFLCAMTHFYVPWLISICQDSFLCAMTHFYVPWLVSMCHEYMNGSFVHGKSKRPIHMCHDSFLCAMTQKSTLLKTHLSGLLYSEVYCTKEIAQKSTLLKSLFYWKHTSAVWFSLLYWKHTWAVYLTQKSILPRQQLKSLRNTSLLLSNVISETRNELLRNANVSQLRRNAISGISHKSLRWHFSRESLRNDTSQKLRNISSEECYLRDFWEMPEMALLRSLLYESLYVVQHAATRCNTLQHAATRCNTL